MSKPRVKSKRSCPVPEVSARAYRRLTLHAITTCVPVVMKSEVVGDRPRGVAHVTGLPGLDPFRDSVLRLTTWRESTNRLTPSDRTP